MLFLGSGGKGRADLHNSNFDFPDELIKVGASIFETIVRSLLDNE